jgi:hypothetical protein
VALLDESLLGQQTLPPQPLGRDKRELESRGAGFAKTLSPQTYRQPLSAAFQGAGLPGGPVIFLF